MKYTKEFEDYWLRDFGYYERNNLRGCFDDKKTRYFKTWKESREQSEKVIDEALKIFEAISRNKYYYNIDGGYCSWAEIVVNKFINENTKTKSIGLWKNVAIEKLDKDQFKEEN